MKIEEITEFPDGTRVVGLLYHPSFEQEMKMWFREKKKRRCDCDYCIDIAEYKVEAGNWECPYIFPKDYYYHHVCRKHLFVRQCIPKNDSNIRFKCDFCDNMADYYIRTGESIKIYDKYFREEDDYPNRHLCCEKHIRIIKIDNFRASEWYSTYMK